MEKKIKEQILSLADKIKQDGKNIKGKKEAQSLNDVRYIKNSFEMNGEVKDIICIVFSKEKDKNGEDILTHRYYIDNELIGVWDQDSYKEPIILSGRIKTQTKELEKLRNLIQNPEKFGAEDISVKEDLEKDAKLLKKFAEELGVSEIELKSMMAIGSKAKSDKKQDKQVKQMKKKEKDTHKVFESDVNVKQYIDVNTKVDEMRTLGQVLKLPPDCIRVDIIETDQLDEVNKDAEGSTRYSFVAINKNGTVEQIATLEEDHSVGSNSTQQTYKVEHDGNVKRNMILSRYKINGTNATLSARNGDMGQVEVFYSPDKSRNGNESLDKQIQTSNVQFSTRTEQRNIAGYYDSKGDYDKVGDAIKRANKVSIKDYDNTEYKDLDDDEKTISDNESEIGLDDIFMYEGEETTLREFADRNGYDDLDELMEEFRNAPGETAEDKLKYVEDKINEQFRGTERKR